MRPRTRALFSLAGLVLFACDDSDPTSASRSGIVGKWIPQTSHTMMWDKQGNKIQDTTMDFLEMMGEDGIREVIVEYTNDSAIEYVRTDTCSGRFGTPYTIVNGRLQTDIGDSLAEDMGIIYESNTITNTGSSLRMKSVGHYADTGIFATLNIGRFETEMILSAYNGALPPSNWPTKACDMESLMGGSDDEPLFKSRESAIDRRIPLFGF